MPASTRRRRRLFAARRHAGEDGRRSARRSARSSSRPSASIRNKAKNVIALSKKLIAEHSAAWCRATRDALETLPGVGRKTANVVLNMAFGEPTIAVDTHIFRVGNRTGLAPGKDPLAVETGARAKVVRRNTCCTRITG